VTRSADCSASYSIEPSSGPELTRHALSQILAIERRLKRRIAEAHRSLRLWMLRRAGATGRISMPTPLLTQTTSDMKAAMMAAAVEAWQAGWARQDRQIERRRAQAGFRENEGPEPPESYLRDYAATVDGALYRYDASIRLQMSELSTQAAVEGWSVEQLTREIKALVTGMTTWQAERIARTEVVRLWNVGSFQRMEQEDEDLIGYEYSVVMDNRTSHFCAPLHGKKVRRDELVYVPPLHPHCRTILEPVYSFDNGAEDIEWQDPQAAKGAPGFGARPPRREPAPAPPPQAPKPKPVPSEPGSGWPADPDALELVRSLGGSTGAELVRGSDGLLYVRKRGASAEHLREECACDAIYRAAGALVPELRLYETSRGPVKLARFSSRASRSKPFWRRAERAQRRPWRICDAISRLMRWWRTGMSWDLISTTSWLTQRATRGALTTAVGCVTGPRARTRRRSSGPVTRMSCGRCVTQGTTGRRRRRSEIWASMRSPDRSRSWRSIDSLCWMPHQRICAM